MPGNGLSFCTALHPAVPPPKTHLALKVRKHHVKGWTLQGDRSNEIGLYHSMARDAVQAVRGFARRHGRTANVILYTPGGDVYCVKEIIRA